MTAVELRLSPALILQSVLRLPPDAIMLGARIVAEDDGWQVLNLTVDMPDAPPDAMSVDVSYTLDTTVPDPMQVTGYRWFAADGTEITRLASVPPPPAG